MAKIKLVETGWSMIPEGDHTFKVESVDYKEDFGKLEINLVTQGGQKHQERYTLTNAKGEMNEGAMKAFSFFAKTALNNKNVEEIDPDDLVGCYVSATVAHVESEAINEKTGKPFVNVRLNDLANVVGFGKGTAKKKAVEAEPEEVEEDEEDVNLDDWLND